MRIICVTAFYTPHLGGVGAYTEHVAEELARMGHEVIVLTSQLSGQSVEPEIMPGPYLLLRLRSRLLIDGRLPLPLVATENATILRWLALWRPDAIVIGTTFYPVCLFMAAFARVHGIPALVVEHVSAYLTMNAPLPDAAIRVYERMMATALKRLGVRFFGVSKASTQWLASQGLRAEGIISNSIDAQTFAQCANGRDFRAECGIATGDTMVVFAGRFTPEKGILHIINAARALASWPRIQFVIAGEGPLEVQIRAVRLPNMHVVGKLDTPALSALMGQADIMCLPSRSEGLPTVLLEAAACQVAPVMTPVGGATELVVEGSCGIVVDATCASGFLEELCGAILFLHENPSVRRVMAKRLHAKVCRDYSWRKTATALVCACEEAIDASAERPYVAGRSS